MSTVVTDRPQSPPRPSRMILAAAKWAVVGAAVAAGGWVVGMVIAHGLLDVQLVTHDIPAARFVEIGVRQAAIGGGWGLLAGLVAGLIRRGADSLANRIAAGAMGAVGGAVFGLIGGGLVPVSVEVAGRTFPVVVSSSLGWAFAGILAGLVVYGWTQVREKPVTGEDEPDEVVEPGVPPIGEGWPRSLFVAGKWAFGGAASAACAWVIGLIAVRIFLGIGPLALALRTQPGESALTVAGFGGGCGLLIGALVGLLRGGTGWDLGRRVAAMATGAVGGLMIGLIGGALCRFPVAAFGRALPVEVSSSQGWAFSGLLAGLVAYGWTTFTEGQERRIREQEQRLRVLTEED